MKEKKKLKPLYIYFFLWIPHHKKKKKKKEEETPVFGFSGEKKKWKGEMNHQNSGLV